MKFKILWFALCYFSFISYSQCDGFSQTLTGTNPLCFDYADGSVSVSLTGGTMPFDIEIVDESGDLHNMFGVPETGFTLPDGWYYSHVTDSEGCTLYDSIYIEDPIPLSIETTTIVDPTSLAECDGSITVNEVFGDGDVLTFIWSPDPYDISGVDANMNNDLCADTYSLTVVNEIGCTTSSVFELGLELSVNDFRTDSIQVWSPNFIDIVVVLPTFEKNYSISLYDLSGRLIYVGTLNGKETIISNIQTGLIFYSVSAYGEVLSKGRVLNRF